MIRTQLVRLLITAAILIVLIGCEGVAEQSKSGSQKSGDCMGIGKDTLVCIYHSEKNSEKFRYYSADGVVFMKEVLGPSQVIVERVAMKNGMPDGMMKTFWPNGRVKSQGYIKDTVLQGEWLTYDSMGRKAEIVKYDEGIPEGRAIGFYENDSIKYIAEHKSGYLSGKMKYFYPSGILKTVGYYTYGEQDSIWTYYDEAGLKTSEYIYDVESHNNAIQKDFYSSGSIKMSTQFINGVEDGKKLYFFETGEIKVSVDIIEGVKHGQEIHFSLSGEIINVASFDKGVRIK